MGSSIRDAVRAKTAEAPSTMPAYRAPDPEKKPDIAGNMGGILIAVVLVVLVIWGAISALGFGYHLIFGAPEASKAEVAVVVPAAVAAPTPEKKEQPSEQPAEIQANAKPDAVSDGMTGPAHLRHPDTSGDIATGDTARAQQMLLTILHKVEKPCARIMWVQPDPNIEHTYDVACRTHSSSTKEVGYIVEPITGVVGVL